MMRDYTQDDHDHDVCVASLSVQIFTVPSLVGDVNVTAMCKYIYTADYAKITTFYHVIQKLLHIFVCWSYDSKKFLPHAINNITLIYSLLQKMWFGLKDLL